jgi:hypothetical protein
VKRNVLGPSLFSLLVFTLLASGLLQSMPAMAASLPGPYATGQGPSAHLSPTTNLNYHGGPVMVGTVTTYAIFWEPTGSYVSPTYNSLILQYFQDVGHSPLYHNNTQYANAKNKHPIHSLLGGSWVDTRPYPGSELQEVDIQHEVTLAMQSNGWTPSIHKIFFVFSAKGEIMCSNLSNYGCTFIGSLCAWHGNMGGTTIYAAQPYAGTDLSSCGVPSSPNHDRDADSTINLISHEQFEAATDPFYDGWYSTNDSYHSEIGDLCVWQFGNLNKYGGDVVWNGHPYEVQKEWDNATSSCVLRGP